LKASIREETVPTDLWKRIRPLEDWKEWTERKKKRRLWEKDKEKLQSRD